MCERMASAAQAAGARSGPEQLDISLGQQRLRARVFVQAAGAHSPDTRISVFTSQGMAELALQDQLAHAGPVVGDIVLY